MRNINFTLNSDLSIAETTKTLTDLLMSEDIGFSVNQNIITTNHIPLPLAYRDLHTKKNWVGMNPFVYISSMEITLIQINNVETQIRVNIDQQRAILLYLLYLCLVLMVVIAAQILLAGVLLFLLMAIISYVFLFSLMIKRLIKSEMVRNITKRP